MAKIFVLGFGAHGHVNPTLALAEELQARGHEVTYFVTEEFRHAVEAAGVSFQAVDSLLAKTERPKKFDKATMLELIPRRMLGEAIYLLDQVVAQFVSNPPDLLLYDNMCIAGRVITEACQIPSVSLFTSYAASETFNMISQLGDLPETARVDFDALMTEIVDKYGVRPFPFETIFAHPEALNIVFMPRIWQPEVDSFDSRFIFVGPCLGTRAADVEFPQEILSGDHLLLISLGTAFNDNPEFYRECFKAFENTSWNIVMAVGTRVDITALGKFPTNFTVRPHVPQLEVLQHASVFVTHGGMNSTMEGLGFGVPLVALPQMFEQAITARRIEEMGVGISLDGRELEASLLRQAVEDVANSSNAKSRVRVVQEAITASGGVRAAAQAVENHLGL
ncbi:MAG: macrolide family glycosyltransferase [Oligoflexales bacterium]